MKCMPSKRQLRRHDATAGISIIAVLVLGVVAGVVFRNWTLIETYLPYLLIVVLIVLFYQLVVAIEYLTYDTL